MKKQVATRQWWPLNPLRDAKGVADRRSVTLLRRWTKKKKITKTLLSNFSEGLLGRRRKQLRNWGLCLSFTGEEKGFTGPNLTLRGGVMMLGKQSERENEVIPFNKVQGGGETLTLVFGSSRRPR